MKEATKETIKKLEDNMLDTGQDLYYQIIQDYMLETATQKGRLDKDVSDKELFIKLIRFNSNLSLMIMEACSIFRAELIADNSFEKRFLLKRLIMIIHEGYKYIFGFSKKKTFGEQFLSSMMSQNEEAVKSIEKAQNKYLQQYGNNTIKILRDVAKHYSYDSLEFYYCIKDLNERDVSDMYCSFMAFSQPLFSLSIKKLREEAGLWYLAIKLQELEVQKIRSFIDEELLNQFNHSISKYGSIIDSINSKSINASKVLEQFDIDSNNKDLKPFLSDNVSMHIFYTIMDVLCALKAFANSVEYYEQSLNLAYLRLSIHEGFKKLYGFNNNDRKKSFWTRLKNDFSEVLPEMNSEINAIEINLNRLMAYDYVTNENVVIFTHFGETKHQNIPYDVVLNFFGNNKEEKNFAIILDIIRVFNSILPLVSRLMEENVRLSNERTRKDIEAWKMKFDDLFNKMRSSVTSDNQGKIEEMRRKLKGNLTDLSNLL
jgi:hypothetical protein